MEGGVLETSTSSSPGSPQGLADIQNGRHGAKGACLDKDLRLAWPAWGRSPSFIEWMTGTHGGMIGLNHLWAGGAYRPSHPRPPAAATAASDISTSTSPSRSTGRRRSAFARGGRAALIPAAGLAAKGHPRSSSRMRLRQVGAQPMGLHAESACSRGTTAHHLTPPLTLGRATSP